MPRSDYIDLNDILNGLDCDYDRERARGTVLRPTETASKPRSTYSPYYPICPKCKAQKHCRQFVYDSWGEPTVCMDCACKQTKANFKAGKDIIPRVHSRNRGKGK